VQQGEPDPNDKKAKPRRTSLPKGLEGDAITLEQALGLLSLPRHVGIHPETKLPIEAGLGRFGPYVKMGPIFGSLDRDDDILSVGLNRAVDVLAKKIASVRMLGPHPKGGETIQVRKGRFGPYVQHGQTVANLPKGVLMDDITLDEAVALLAEKGKVLKPKGKGKTAKSAKSAKPAAAKTAAPKKPAAPAARKAPAKKKPAAVKAKKTA
jgi:DNA topoisomerase-1